MPDWFLHDQGLPRRLGVTSLALAELHRSTALGASDVLSSAGYDGVNEGAALPSS